jgi:ribosomal subunit interface protein
MSINITGRHVDMSPAITSYATEAVDALMKKYGMEAVGGEVTFSKPLYVFEAEVSLHLKRGVYLRASGEGDTAYLAMDQACHKLETKVRKHKKMLDHHHKMRDQHIEKFSAFDYVLDSQKEQEPSSEHPPIIAESTTDIPTLSVTEAAMRLDLGDLHTVIFKNPKHGGLNVLYRRKDGNIAWVDPSLIRG